MSWFSLLWANLFRKRTRTTLTLLSLVVAFLLFVLLRSIAAAFSGGIAVAGVDRLVVSPKYSITDNLPISQLQQIGAVDGVDAVTHQNWFGGQYQDPGNFFAKYPVDPVAYFDMYPEFLVAPEDLERFARTRTGAMAARSLAERFGWQPGDIVPIQADIWPKDDGTRLWEFEYIGSIGTPEGEAEVPQFVFHYEYFTEAVAAFGKDQVGWWTVRVADPDRASEIATEIDALFGNSPDPTRTATEDEFSRQFANQIGDMGFITTTIMAAVFFTIVLLTANTMTQALRERVPELAVLKTLGFTDASVSMLVLCEALVLCVLGGGIGIGLALLLEPGLKAGLQQLIGVFEVNGSTILSALGLAGVIGVVIGAVPALTAKSLSIVDALRGGQ